jgi:hypothetical protein
MTDQLALDDVLNHNEEPVAPEEGDLINDMITSLGNMNDLLQKQHFAITQHEERINQLEKYISYLLLKDPEMGPKMKAMADANDKSKNQG